jgi:hypothetical protein
MSYKEFEPEVLISSIDFPPYRILWGGFPVLERNSEELR